MNKIKIIKKFKAYFIRLKLHKVIGFLADYLIYIGYLSKLSKWIDTHKKDLKFNDFYNSTVIHKNRIQLYKFLIDSLDLRDEEINYIEFGVAKGDSMRWWLENNKNLASTFWGFDTFEGLPEKWGTYDKGTFSMEGKYPNIKDSRLTFVKGLFQNTLIGTISKINFTKRNIIHLDADLYSSTLFSMLTLFKYLNEGDLIFFDEFGVPLHEFKAYDDFTKSFYIELQPIGAINNYLQMAFIVKKT